MKPNDLVKALAPQTIEETIETLPLGVVATTIIMKIHDMMSTVVDVMIVTCIVKIEIEIGMLMRVIDAVKTLNLPQDHNDHLQIRSPSAVNITCEWLSAVNV